MTPTTRKLATRSAFKIDAKHRVTGTRLKNFTEDVIRLSRVLKQKFDVFFFHDLSKDVFAVTVEGKTYSLGESRSSFDGTLKAASKKIEIYLRKVRNESRQKEKRPSRTASGRRYRR